MNNGTGLPASREGGGLVLGSQAPAYTRPREAGCLASRASVSSLYGEGGR